MSAAVYAHPRFAPLPGKAKTPLWREIAAELAQRPGQWAAVAEQVGFRTPLTRRQAEREAIAATVVEIGPRRQTGRILEGASR